MSTLEIVTIVLMLLFGLAGFISGLVKKIGTISAAVLGLVVAFFVASPINNNFVIETEFFKETVVGWVGSESTASIVTLVAVWLIAFIIVFLIVWFIFRTIKSLMEKSKILSVVDKFLGLALGAAFGLVLGGVILIIVSFIADLSDGLATWLESDLESGIGLIQWMYNTFVPSALNLVDSAKETATDALTNTEGILSVLIVK